MKEKPVNGYCDKCKVKPATFFTPAWIKWCGECLTKATSGAIDKINEK